MTNHTPRTSRAPSRPYQAWLLWRVTERCNLTCEFCYHSIESLKHGSAPAIEVDPFLETLRQTGLTFSVTFTGGEPFLAPNLIEAAARITEDHYVSFNTNLIHPRVRKLPGRVNPERVLDCLASVHITELERTGLTGKFIDNMLFLHDNGFKQFQAAEVAFPTLAPRAEELRGWFQERGVRLLFQPYVGEYQGKDYPAAYTQEELRAFRLNILPGFRVKNHYQRGELCNAGLNFGAVTADGQIRLCWDVDEPIGHAYRGIEFRDKPIRCPIRRCLCPINKYDPALFAAAIDQD